jgi:hypothetical protein
MGVKPSSRGCFGWFIVAVILALIIGAIVYTVKKKSEKSEGPAPIPGPPGATDKKYADALKIATQFFDIQKCKFSRRTPPPPPFFFISVNIV